MKLYMELGEHSYNITIKRGGLEKINEYFDLARRVLVVTDSGVPEIYSKKVASACQQAEIVTIPQGEESKSLENLELLCKTMLERGFTRTDCVVAVGGGVVGDLAGFAAAVYMRGIDFYNFPTTLLSQVDSSIGGKVAVDFCGVKNILGAFHQPKAVLIDPETLNTLPERHFSNGLAEAIKMALTSDRELFELFEKEDIKKNTDLIIEKALCIKKSVVEKDEKETGLRKILNFGHTLGHGIEAAQNLHGLLHGECVALGMIPMCGKELRPRLLNVLQKAGLPLDYPYDLEAALVQASHDKKCDGNTISVIFTEEAGSFKIKKMTIEDWKKEVRVNLKEMDRIVSDKEQKRIYKI